jgi:predicted ATPase
MSSSCGVEVWLLLHYHSSLIPAHLPYSKWTKSRFQKYLYQQLSQAELAYLHQAIGIALEELYEEQSSEIAVRLARHFQEAGMAEKAIDYLRQAGERAAGLSAHQEAVAHFRQGLHWLETLPEGSQRARLELSLSLGLAMSLQAITGYRDPKVGRLYT